MVDNLYYQDGMTQKRIVEANVSYFVLGWHADSPDLFSLKTGNRGDRLAALNMILQDEQSSDVTNKVGSSNSARSLCHGSKYEVKWSLDQALQYQLTDTVRPLWKHLVCPSQRLHETQY